MLPYLTQQNWLLGYASFAGLSRALQGLSRRAAPGSHMETAPQELQANYEAYEADFREFFPLLQGYVSEQLAVNGYQ
jgi:acyl carrier protein phosphodiesterase